MFLEGVVSLVEELQLWIVLDWWMLSSGRLEEHSSLDDTCAATWKFRRPSWVLVRACHNHVYTLNRTEVWPARDVGHWNADVPEISWTKTADTVKSSKCYLELYSLKHGQPVKDITKDWSEVVAALSTICTLVLTRRIERRYSSQPGSQRRLHYGQSTSSVGCHGPPYTSSFHSW